MADEATETEAKLEAQAGLGASGIDDTVRQGGVNQGQGSGTGGDLNDDSVANAELRRRRMAVGDLIDDNAAAHMGGMGAQGGVADLASQGNTAGMGGGLAGGKKPQP